MGSHTGGRKDRAGAESLSAQVLKEKDSLLILHISRLSEAELVKISPHSVACVLAQNNSKIQNKS